MQKVMLNQSKDGKGLQPNLTLRLQILTQRHSPVSMRSFGFQRYYSSQSPSPIDRKDFIQRVSIQRFLPCSQIHWARREQATKEVLLPREKPFSQGKTKDYFFPKAKSATLITFAMSFSACAKLKNHASKGDGGRKIPRLNIA